MVSPIYISVLIEFIFTALFHWLLPQKLDIYSIKTPAVLFLLVMALYSEYVNADNQYKINI